MKPAEIQPPPLPADRGAALRAAAAAEETTVRTSGASPADLPLRAGVPRPDGGARHALQSLGFLLGLMLLAWVALRFELPLPPCPLRALTDAPCPFCGSTRTFAALARLDFAAALRLNPLVCVGAVAAAVVWLLTLRRGADRGRRMTASWTKGTAWKWLLAIALALNWLYLWFHLPR